MATIEERKTTDAQMLMEAAESGDAQQLSELISAGADVNYRTPSGETALMRAAAHGRLRCVRVLLEHGAEVNGQRGDGLTALMRAAFFGQAEVVRELVERGADVAARDRLGLTAVEWAASKGYPEIVSFLINRKSINHTASSFNTEDSQTFIPVSNPPPQFDTSSSSLDFPNYPQAHENEPAIDHTGASTARASAVLPQEKDDRDTLNGDVDALEDDMLASGVGASGTTKEIIEASAPYSPVAPSRLETDAPTLKSHRIPVRDGDSRRRPRRSRLFWTVYVGLTIAVAFIFGALVWFGVERIRSSSSNSPAASNAPTLVSNDASQEKGAQQNAPSANGVNVSPPAQTKTDATASPSDTQTREGASDIGRGAQSEDTQQSAPQPTREQAALRAALGVWVDAANSRDIDKQMSFYAPTLDAFYRSRNVSRQAARSEKARLSAQAGQVNIRVDKPDITFSDDGRKATMRFNKTYATGKGTRARRGEVIQELIWQRTDGRWKIVSERDVRVIK